jgi:hypothetical protein
MSTSSSSAVANPLGQLILEKLSRDNFIIWKAQIFAAIRGARLDGHMDGTASAPSKTIQVEQTDKTMKAEANPAYANWYVQDQQLLSFLFNTARTGDVFFPVPGTDHSFTV